MREAFLFGATFGLGLSIAFAVCCLTATAVMTVLEKVSARHRHRWVVREAMAALGEEDIAALLWGEEDAGEGEGLGESPPGIPRPPALRRPSC